MMNLFGVALMLVLYRFGLVFLVSFRIGFIFGFDAFYILT